MQQRCDVLVVGGGAAGATAARICAASGASVLVAATHPGRAPVGECLAPRGRRVLSDLHPSFRQEAHLPFVGTVSRWADDEINERSFIYNPDGHGLRLNRAAFDADMRCSAEAAGAEWCSIDRLISSVRVGARWHLKLCSTDGLKEVAATYVIDCSGRARLFTRSIGVGVGYFDRLVALVLALDSDEEDSRLTVDAAPLGWWYSVVAPQGRRVTAFMTDSAIVREQNLRRLGALATMCRGDEGLMARQSGFWSRIPVLAVTAATTKLNELAGENWCAAGDAATTLDPLSSQGLLKALESGRAAAKATLSDRLAVYGEWVEDDFQRYLANRLAHYRGNQRWNKSEFWHRRMV